MPRLLVSRNIEDESGRAGGLGLG
eukprot:COSAG01_NODE_60269_length_295_cov_1.846939_1_plen_23_part_10